LLYSNSKKNNKQKEDSGDLVTFLSSEDKNLVNPMIHHLTSAKVTRLYFAAIFQTENLLSNY